ncbi:MAG: hypothetical protein KJ064_13300 [Anaerolineae bacterium]|nr:hypothetical protein [Anaerolineae bacterium]
MPDYGLWENPLSRIIEDVEAKTSAARRQDDTPPTQKADFHFLYLAPGVSVDYLFVAARKYWETFRTIVVHDLSLIQHVPRRYSVAITSLSRTDTASLVNDQITSLFGQRVYHDPLVYDFPEDLQLTLDARAERNEPFGVPLQQ